MGDNKEFDDSAIFWAVLLIVGGGKLQNIEDPSLVGLGYQLLPLATSKLMGDNVEFDDSAIFWGVLLIVRGKASEYWRYIIGWPWLLNVAPINQSEYAKLQSYFDIFWDRTLILQRSSQSEILHSLIFYIFVMYYHSIQTI